MTTLDKAEFQTATSFTARQINRRVILNIIQRHQPISRADAARQTGLQRSTVSLIVDDLISEGWIVEGEMGRIPRGRRPTYLKMNADGARLLGIHVDAGKAYALLANLNGEEAWNYSADLKDESLDSLRAALRDVQSALRPVLGDLDLKGIGIACGNCKFQPLEMEQVGEDVFGCCTIADSVAVACGEWYLLRSAENKNDTRGHLVSIFAGNCIELAVLLNGVPYRGAHGRAGKLPSDPAANGHGISLADHMAFSVAAYDPGMILITGDQVNDEAAVRPALERRLKEIGASATILKIVSANGTGENQEERLYTKASVALILSHYLSECDV